MYCLNVKRTQRSCFVEGEHLLTRHFEPANCGGNKNAIDRSAAAVNAEYEVKNGGA